MGSGRYIKKKKEMKFQSVEALQQVVNVVNEASDALSDKKRTIRESAIPEVLLGAIGAGAGGAISFTALYGLGTVGLSAAGITSGLAAAGAGASAVMGGLLSPMVAGIFVLALPAAGLAAAGVGTAVHMKNRQLRQEKQALNESRERQEYLQSLNTLLARAVQDLKHDLGYAS